jgi:hypothetical protein
MEETWISLSQAVKLTAQWLNISDRMARTLLLNDAFPNGVGFGGDKEIKPYKLEQPAGPRSLMRRWCTPESHFTEIDPKSLVHAVINWNEETIDYPPGTLSKRPHRLVRLRVSADDLEAWLKQTGASAAKPKRKYTRSEHKDAEVKRKIEIVLDHWKNWPKLRRKLDERQQARLLCQELKGKVDFSEDTIRAILRGEYKPMTRLGIPKPKAGLR